MKLYVVARSAVSKRPMCQHSVEGLRAGAILTVCGRLIQGTSNEYTEHRLNSIMCQRCMRQETR